MRSSAWELPIPYNSPVNAARATADDPSMRGRAPILILEQLASVRSDAAAVNRISSAERPTSTSSPLFAQDSITLGDLTLNFGLRFDRYDGLTRRKRLAAARGILLSVQADQDRHSRRLQPHHGNAHQ